MKGRALIFEIFLAGHDETVRIYHDGLVVGLPEGSRVNNLITPLLAQRLAQEGQDVRDQG